MHATRWLIFGLIFFTLQAHSAVPEYLRGVARGLGNAGVLSEMARGGAVLSTATLSRVGGVLFQGVLEDSSYLKDVKSVTVSRDGESGRLNIHYKNGETKYYEAPYWLFYPTVRYALDVDNAAVSLFGRPSEAELEKISPSASKASAAIRRYNEIIDQANSCFDNPQTTFCLELLTNQYKIEQELIALKSEIDKYQIQSENEILEYTSYFFFADIHPALNSNAVGLRLLQADSMLMDASYVEVISVRGKKTSFPGEVETAGESERILLNTLIGEAMVKCSDEANGRKPQAWILTDVETNYELKIIGDQFTIHGSPYYYMWDMDANNNSQEVASCTDAFKELRASFYMLAPRTWNATVKVAQLSALLRTLEQVYPKLIEDLSSSESLTQYQLTSITPRAWPRQGYEDF
jgi:hypothetical protein